MCWYYSTRRSVANPQLPANTHAIGQFDDMRWEHLTFRTQCRLGCPASDEPNQPATQGQSPSGPISGHPTVLTDTECNGVWMDAVSGGDVLTGDKAAGYITDFKQADTDQDGKISHESAKMGKDVGTHPGGAGEAPPVESGKIQGQ